MQKRCSLLGMSFCRKSKATWKKRGEQIFVKRKHAQKKAGDKAKGGESSKGQKPVMVKTGAKGLDKKNDLHVIQM